MKRKVYAKAVTMCLSAAMLIGMTGVSAKAEESTITFTPVSSIKVGEELWGQFQYHNAEAGMTPTIQIAEKNNFFTMGSGGGFPEYPSEGPVTLVFSDDYLALSQAVYPGIVEAKCYANYDDYREGKAAVASYPVEIESPVITTNLEETYYVNDTVDFQTEVTNVSLPEGDIAELQAIADSNVTGDFTYQATIEVVEGQDDVVIENEDCSQSLSSSETLTFTGTGSVTLKITYQPVRLGNGLKHPGDPWIDEDFKNMEEAIYKPETYVTVQVVDAKAVLSDEINNTMNAGLEQSQYTAESWNTFDQALKNAQTVLAAADSTNEMYVQACQALKTAREGLVEVSEPIVTPEPEEPTVTPEPDENNPLTPDNISQTLSDTDKKEDAKPVKADTVNSQSVKTQAVQTSDENSYFLPITIAGIAMGLGLVLAYVKRRITVNR